MRWSLGQIQPLGDVCYRTESGSLIVLISWFLARSLAQAGIVLWALFRKTHARDNTAHLVELRRMLEKKRFGLNYQG